MARQAYRIPAWFNVRNGHEPNNNGKPYKKGLEWYIAPVHSGETVERMIETIGPDRCARCVFVYDQLCQRSATHRRERRGWVLDQLGKPMTAAHLSRHLGLEGHWLGPILEDLINQGWLTLEPFTDPLLVDTDRPLSGTGTTATGPSGSSGDGFSELSENGRVFPGNRLVAEAEAEAEAEVEVAVAAPAEDCPPSLPNASRLPRNAKALLAVSRDGPVAILERRGGLDRAAAIVLVRDTGCTAERATLACEAADAKMASGTLKKSKQHYVAGFIRHGWRSPKELAGGAR